MKTLSCLLFLLASAVLCFGQVSGVSASDVNIGSALQPNHNYMGYTQVTNMSSAGIYLVLSSSSVSSGDGCPSAQGATARWGVNSHAGQSIPIQFTTTGSLCSQAGQHCSTVSIPVEDSTGHSLGSISLHVCGTVGTSFIQEPDAIAGTPLLHSYPNPAHAVSQVEFDVARGGTVQLQIVDALGRVQQSNNGIECAPGHHTAAINTSALACGFHRVVVLSGHAVIATGSLVVAR